MNQKLIDARKAAGLFQRQLADKAGLCRSTIAAMERGTHGSDMYSKLQVCKALGKEYKELFGEESQNEHYH